jgi:hypothetical protein
MRPTEQQKRWLKKQVHHLKPVVSLGQAGLTAPVLAEIELALDHHELIKVKIAAGDRDLRDEFIVDHRQPHPERPHRPHRQRRRLLPRQSPQQGADGIAPGLSPRNGFVW